MVPILNPEERIRQLETEVARYRALVARLQVRDTVADIVAESSSPGDAIPAILRAICESMSWNVGVFWAPLGDSGVLRAESIWSGGKFPNFVAATEGSTRSPGVGLPGRVWLQQEAAWITELKQDDNFPRARAAERDGLRSGCAFPIRVEESPVGLLEFFTTDRREPDSEILETFALIGQQTGVFLERKKLEEQLLRQAKIASLRADLSEALGRFSDIRTILGECTDALVRHLDVAFARVWTLNHPERMLELQASSGLYTHIDGGHSKIPVGAFKIGWIAENRKPHLTNSVPDDPRVTNQDWARREGMQAFAGYPLLVEERLMGVLAVFSRKKLDERVLEEFDPIANALAQFLDRRRAEDELRKSEALKAAMLETALDAIVAMNHTGRIVEFNLAAEAMFGYRRADVIGRPLADVMVPARLRDAHRVGLARYLRTGEAQVIGRRIEMPAMRSDGSEFPVELSIGRIATDGPSVFTACIRALPASA